MKNIIVGDIKKRLCLTQKAMAEILNVSVQELKRMENEDVNVDAKIVEKLTEVFDIGEEEIKEGNLKENLLSLTLKIDVKKYDNIFKAYVETLKRFFPESLEIYVLSKVKVKKGIGGIFDLFFNNNKVSVASEMKSFSPSYLVIKDKAKLIVNFEKDVLKIFELGDIVNDKRFEFEGHRYTRANKIEFK